MRLQVHRLDLPGMYADLRDFQGIRGCIFNRMSVCTVAYRLPGLGVSSVARLSLNQFPDEVPVQ